MNNTAHKPDTKRENFWYIYIVQCDDFTLYTGITTDISRRISEHNSSKKGAKYTRNRRPVLLVYSEEAPSRSAAAIRESQIKKMTATAKKRLFERIRE